jgi:hypothetical protein
LKLFDHNARDYYNHSNPVVKILMPRMNYAPEERLEVIRQAYRGLFELTAPVMFDKYVDFIDVYAGIREDEREAISRGITEQEDTGKGVGSLDIYSPSPCGRGSGGGG